MTLSDAHSPDPTDVPEIRRLHAEKAGIRCLAIAESFAHGSEVSTLAGIVMRRDGIVDGAVFGTADVSGDNATSSMAEMYARLARCDISYVLVSGLSISMHNVVDIQALAHQTRIPAIGVTYCDSGTDSERFASVPDRERMRLSTGHDVFVAYAGCSHSDVKSVLDSVTHQGAIPEPIRIAQLVAHAAHLRIP